MWCRPVEGDISYHLGAFDRCCSGEENAPQFIDLCASEFPRASINRSYNEFVHKTVLRRDDVDSMTSNIAPRAHADVNRESRAANKIFNLIGCLMPQVP